ncbi:hypothetical protein IW150_001434 [Coemansia sp. RSA 2607]|nr:hypothetical protein GGI05_007498 [Coemansia sp. RSA 2603]KAJ2377335.1 hypothetical protein IW150_001434 [Coemansia sp. RSA 2607]
MGEGRYVRGRTNNTVDDASPPAARRRATSRTTQAKATSLLRVMNPHDQPAEQETYGTTGTSTYGMSQDMREDIEKIFNAMDPKGRGFLKLTSLSIVLESLHLIQRGEQIPDEWYDEIDPRKTGKITLDALLEFVSIRDADGDAEQQMAAAFRLFKPEADDVHSARITFEDLHRVAAHLGERIPDSELRDMVEFIDSERSGGVGFDDFKLMMRRTGLF